mmetsp:Transcript_18863/g.54079  ORF Transcript_18863/g.54079 Transcript_18863/m.54079 type:complete len:279 (-) Transcript_18863:1141-1977(-)
MLVLVNSPASVSLGNLVQISRFLTDGSPSACGHLMAPVALFSSTYSESSLASSPMAAKTEDASSTDTPSKSNTPASAGSRTPACMMCCMAVQATLPLRCTLVTLGKAWRLMNAVCAMMWAGSCVGLVSSVTTFREAAFLKVRDAASSSAAADDALSPPPSSPSFHTTSSVWSARSLSAVLTNGVVTRADAPRRARSKTDEEPLVKWNMMGVSGDLLTAAWRNSSAASFGMMDASTWVPTCASMDVREWHLRATNASLSRIRSLSAPLPSMCSSPMLSS